MTTGVRIALTGRMAAGKDHCAEYLIDEHGFEKASFASAIKALWKPIQEIAGFPNDKGFARPYLQAMGSAGRAFDPDMWVRTTLASLKPDGNYVITDLRFPDEADRLRNAGFFIVKVETADDVRRERLMKRDGRHDPATENDTTEQSVDAIVPDAVVRGENEASGETRRRLRSYVELLEDGFAPSGVAGVLESIERGLEEALRDDTEKSA